MNATALNVNGKSGARDLVSVPVLRRWMDGRWALFFSHPDDFAAYDFETERWLAYVRDAFVANGIRALGPASTAQEACATWTTKIGGVAPRISLGELRRTLVESDHLIGSVEGSPDAWQRFVLLVDEAARLRWSLHYRPEERLPSPIELAAFAKAKRAQQAAAPAVLARQPLRSRLHIVSTGRVWLRQQRHSGQVG